MTRKTTNTYFFSVEGQTESWYFAHLEKLINNSSSATCFVKFKVEVEKDPVAFSKRLRSVGETKVTHVCDVEGNSFHDTQKFLGTINRLKQAKNLGKRIKYELGYSNLTFELWIILHKNNCSRCIRNHAQYLQSINQAYQQNFESLDKYKKEHNFKNKILNNVTLDDVINAIRRAQKITEDNHLTFRPKSYNGYSYFEHNPSISLWKSIERILKDASLL